MIRDCCRNPINDRHSAITRRRIKESFSIALVTAITDALVAPMMKATVFAAASGGRRCSRFSTPFFGR